MIIPAALLSFIAYLSGSLSAYPHENENVMVETAHFREGTPGSDLSRNSSESPTDVIMYLFKRRVFLVSLMLDTEKQMDAQLALGNQEAGKILTTLLDNDILPRIDELAMAIYNNIGTDFEAELSFHQEIRVNLTRIHYKAGSRQCENHDEAYNEATKRCEKLENYQFGPFIGKETAGASQTAICPLKERQVFIEVDFKRNIGKCVCRGLDVYGRELFYSLKDDQCYVENEKGFCGEGQWTVKEEGILKCGEKPTNCPGDGFHAYGNIRGVTKEAGCHALHSQGPCEANMQITRDKTSGTLVCAGDPNAL